MIYKKKVTKNFFLISKYSEYFQSLYSLFAIFRQYIDHVAYYGLIPRNLLYQND